MIDLGLSDDYLSGYQTRLNGEPFDKNKSDEWQMGWMNAYNALLIDKETIIKGVECCRRGAGPDCQNCSYRFPEEGCCELNLLDDVWKLLMKDEPKAVGKQFDDCPRCHRVLSRIHDMHYCGTCGQAVKWE